MTKNSAIYQKGAKLAKELFGSPGGEFGNLPLAEGDDLDKELVSYLYGYLMQERPGLDMRLKLLSAISMLTVLQREDMLADWVKAALKHGCTKEEIREVIVSMGIYAGWPVARRGLVVTGKLLK